MAKKRPRPLHNRFARREATREPYESVLIVCEGKKTEPKYFEGLKTEFQLSNANVVVAPFGEQGGNDPVTVVEYAIGRLRQAPSDWDHVYCVFDRDGHAQYDQACRLARDSEFFKARKLHLATSWPCFELWVLLHYKYTATPFNRAGAKSACDRVIDEIEKHYPDYEKNFDEAFKELFPRTQAAIQNGTALHRENAATGSLNPATLVHQLVAKLRGLRHGIP